MEKNSKAVLYLIILGLVFFILYLEGCFGSPEKGEKVNIGGKSYLVIKREIDTVYETKREIEYRRGKDIVREVEVVKEIPANVDTMAILEDYYSVFFYRDTFRLKDTLGYFVVNDTISRNKIQSRGFESLLRIPKVKEEIYVKELSNSFYLGPALQVGGIISIGADAHLKTKNDMLYGFGMGLGSNSFLYIRGSVGWKINK
jgi:hypothetical protein